MKPKDLIGAKIISIEESQHLGADIQEIIVEKDNKHIIICGTEDYPWIAFYIDKRFCPKCKIQLNDTINKEKHVPEYICKKCDYKE